MGAQGKKMRLGDRSFENIVRTDERYGHDGFWLGPRGRDYGALLEHPKPYQIAKRGIGLIPQGRSIFPSLSVKENLMMAARMQGRSGEWTLEKVYKRFPILKARSNLKGNLLSGGEQQMLATGRGLMTNPDLLLMDEPSEGLAPLVVREIRSIIGKLKEAGLSILLVEQNLPMALGVSDYVFIMSKGMIVHESTPKELQTDEDIKIKYLSATK